MWSTVLDFFSLLLHTLHSCHIAPKQRKECSVSYIARKSLCEKEEIHCLRLRSVGCALSSDGGVKEMNEQWALKVEGIHVVVFLVNIFFNQQIDSNENIALRSALTFPGIQISAYWCGNISRSSAKKKKSFPTQLFIDSKVYEDIFFFLAALPARLIC